MKLFCLLLIFFSTQVPHVYGRMGDFFKISPPSLPPVLPSNPEGSIRRASSASNDPEPLLDILGLNKVDSTSIPNAFCNDGSRPIYYHRQGSGQGAKRWVIWLEGGSGCGSDDPASPYWCGHRKNTVMSTSNGFPIVLKGLGIFSGLKAKNPDFYSYNHVMIHYCSGDFWRGQGIQKVIDKSTKEQWWFSGQRILEAVLKDLEKKKGFSNASNIILTGTSAGAIGATMNANLLKSLYPTKDIVTVIDAGWVNPFQRFDPMKAGGFNDEAVIDPELIFSSYEFTQAQPDQACILSVNYCPPFAKCMNRSKWCMLPGVAARYLKVPFFAIHDHYDRVLGFLGYNFDVCKYSDQAKYQTWLTNHELVTQNSMGPVQGFYQTRSGQHGMLITDFFQNYTAANGSDSYKLREILGFWYFTRSGKPSTWMESRIQGMTPEQETRSKNGCAYNFTDT
jgi:hypothetical protein